MKCRNDWYISESTAGIMSTFRTKQLSQIIAFSGMVSDRTKVPIYFKKPGAKWVLTPSTKLRVIMSCYGSNPTIRKEAVCEAQGGAFSHSTKKVQNFCKSKLADSDLWTSGSLPARMSTPMTMSCYVFLRIIQKNTHLNISPKAAINEEWVRMFSDIAVIASNRNYIE